MNRLKSKFMRLWNIAAVNKDKKYIRSIKDSCKGKRCFIIGNGPSLRADDLERLKNEITFSSHRIYEIFGKTAWRPNYYCAQDHTLILQSKKDIDNINADVKLIAVWDGMPVPRIKGARYIRLIAEEYYPHHPKFAERLSEGFYEGYTVTYMCLQLAAYMGFDEIYLLGIDHSYSVSMNASGEVVKQEGIRDHFSENDKIANIPQLHKSTLAYEAARAYAEQHGIKILNATRGGSLETFERISLDSVLND